jgi:hypothetical protein
MKRTIICLTLFGASALIVGIFVLPKYWPTEIVEVYPAGYDNDLNREAVWQGAFKAGAHVRYHTGLAAHYEHIGGFAKWGSVVLGIVAFGWPLLFSTLSKRQKQAWAAIGCIALLCSMFASFTKYYELYASHTVLASRWNNLEAEWDELLRERDDIPESDLKSRIRRLAWEERAIEAAEPPGDGGERFARAWQEERRVRVPQVKSAGHPKSNIHATR